MNKVMKMMVAVAALFVGVATSQAVDYSYSGANNGDWATAGNWAPAAAPNLIPTNTYTINNGAMVVYSPGGDWANNSTVLVDGAGSGWIQGGGNGAWIKIGDGGGNSGTVNVTNGASWSSGTSTSLTVFLGNGGANGFVTVGAGSSFSTLGTLAINNNSVFNNSGTLTQATFQLNNNGIFHNNVGGIFSSGAGTTLAAGTQFTNAGTATFTSQLNVDGALTLSGGVTSLAGNLVGAGTMVFSGGTVNVGSEIQVSATISGSTVNTNLIAFQGGGKVISFSSGAINVNSNAYQGIFNAGGATSYLDFSTNSTGLLFVNGLSVATVGTLLTDGRVRLNGVTNAGAFTLTDQNGGLYIGLPGVSPIPEPSTYALLAMGAVSLFALRRFRKA